MFSSKLLAAALIALLTFGSANAQIPVTGAGSAGGSADTGVITPVSNACISSSGTTITFTAQGTGAANAGRVSVVSINWSNSGGSTSSISGMTIGGIAMTRAVRASQVVAASNSEVWYVANPTGTSANVVATFSSAVDGITIEVYSLVGYVLNPLTSYGTTTLTQSYQNKQVGIAAGSRRVNVSTSLSNMVNDYSVACGAGLWGVHASQRLSGNNGSLTTAMSPTASTPQMVLAVFAQSVDCTTPTAAWVARTTSLGNSYKTPISTYICSLVTHNLWNNIDAIWIFANQDTTNAVLNLKSSSYNVIANGSPSFAAGLGYTGVNGSSTVYLDTQFNTGNGVANGNYTQDFAHISVWNLTNSTAGADIIGNRLSGFNNITQIAFVAGPSGAFKLNATTGTTSVGISSVLGQTIIVRTGTQVWYQNGVTVGNDTLHNSTSPPNNNVYILGANSNGTASGAAYQIPMASIGGTLSSSDASAFYTDTRTLMTALGVP